MTVEIKAIETSYKGYRFRSRLEARWAVFLDALKVRWEYEKEGFHLPAGDYLPDFWVCYRPEHHGRPHPEGMPPTPGFWLEIKPAPLSDHEALLCSQLAALTRHNVYAVAGNIGRGEAVAYKWVHTSGQLVGKPEMLGMGRYTPDLFLYYLMVDAAESYDFGRLASAFQAARSARFGTNGRG